MANYHGSATHQWPIIMDQPHTDIEGQIKECVGHVQKRVGTRLRKLKIDVKGLGGKGKLLDKITMVMSSGVSPTFNPFSVNSRISSNSRFNI